MPDELLDVLSSVLCKGLTAAQAAELAADMVPMETPAGRYVVREGEPPTGLLILLRGTVEIIKQIPDGESQTIATVTAPTVIGEMGAVTAEARAASVKTVTACHFWLLARADLQRLLEGESLAAYKLVAGIADVLARRLALMNRKVVEFSERHREEAPVEELDALRHRLFSDWSA